MSGHAYLGQEIPLAVADVVDALSNELLSIGFTSEIGEMVYAAGSEQVDDSSVVMDMTDGTRFQITVKKL